MIYKFKEGSHLRRSAQAVGECLARLESHGNLTPEVVLQTARESSSPLHSLFEWDDSKAAERYRLDQAGHVIRCVTVLLDEPQHDGPREIRAFVPITTETERRQYVHTMRALSDVDLRRQVLEQAHAELGAVAKKYRELKELSEIVSAIDKVGDLLEEQSRATQV